MPRGRARRWGRRAGACPTPPSSGPIAAAWAVAVAAQADRAGVGCCTTTRLAQGTVAPWAALGLFLVAWQLMIAAMMLPSSLPLIRLFGRVSANQPRPRRGQGGVPGRLRRGVERLRRRRLRCGDLGSTALVDRWPWLAARPWRCSAGRSWCWRGRSSSPSSRTAACGCAGTRPATCSGTTGGARGGLPAGGRPRGLLCRLLLGPDAGRLRRRGGQPVVDGGADRGDGVREDRPTTAAAGSGPSGSGSSSSGSSCSPLGRRIATLAGGPHAPKLALAAVLACWPAVSWPPRCATAAPPTRPPPCGPGARAPRPPRPPPSRPPPTATPSGPPGWS